LSKKVFVKSNNGASMAEYSILIGLVSAIAIGAVLGTGQEVLDTFSYAETALRDTINDDTDEDEPTPPPEDPYKDDVDPSDWLILTDQEDTATLAGHKGVYGKAGSDDITGTTSTEIFIGGPGDDLMRSGGGDDRFIYSIGDGSDTIEAYRRHYRPDETLELRDIASTDVTMRQTAYDGDAIITMPDGAEVTINRQMAGRQTRKIETFEFSDVTYDDQMLRDRIVSDMKAEGVTLRGTGLGENYYHHAGDPSYEIYDYYDYINNHTDTLTFTDHAPDDVEFINDGTDLAINLGGSTVTLARQDQSSASNYFIEQIHMQGGVTMDPQAQRDKANEDAKKYGIVRGFHHSDNFYHTAAEDGDYTITDHSYIGSSHDSLIFTDQSSTDVTVYQIGNDAVIHTAGDKTAVTITRQLSHSDYEIESIVFQDATWTADDLATRVSPDAPPPRPAPGPGGDGGSDGGGDGGSDGGGGGGGGSTAWCAPDGWTYDHTNDTYEVPGLTFFAKENPPSQRSAMTENGATSTIQIPNPSALDVYGEYSHKHQTYSWHYWNYTYSLPKGVATRPHSGCQ
jgi:Flp pilus assembly pilin Flp